jgi:poly(U)-specific endoribonuclease
MSEHIYQAIWTEDEHRFSVSARKSDGSWDNPGANILLDEQVKAAGSRQIDLATNPLFFQVDFDKMDDSPLYQSFIRLLDNYAVHFRDPEIGSPAEDAEIDRFLDLVMASRPMVIAFGHISGVLVPDMTPEQFVADLRTMWFEVYTNFYRGKSTHFCTGFEHVFVGEGKYKKSANAAAEKGEISGYHSWVKFALDEINSRVDYLGYKYDLGGPGPQNPHVVTLQMLWNHQDMSGNLVAELFKSKGGFFVGCSPACEMALATVAFYEGHLGLLSNQKKRVKLGDGTFDLVMYHETTQEGGLGDHIRSFYPVYLGEGASDTSGSGTVIVQPRPVQMRNDGSLRIRSALPNPTGDDQGTEWVEIWNAGPTDVLLDGYELRDKMSRPQPIGTVTLAAGETLKVMITRASVHHMQMSNRKGLVTLHDQTGEMLASVFYGRAEENMVLTFMDQA